MYIIYTLYIKHCIKTDEKDKSQNVVSIMV